MATKVRIPSRVTDVLIRDKLWKKKNLKASEFRIHPNIIDRAIESLEE